MTNWSLRRQLVWLIAAASSIAMAIAFFVVDFQFQTKLDSQNRAHMKQVSELYAQMAAPLMATTNKDLLFDLINGAIGKGPIKGLVFYDPSGNLIQSGSAKNIDLAESSFLDRTMIVGTQNLGKMRIYYSNAVIAPIKRAAFGPIGTAFVFGNALVIFLFSYVMGLKSRSVNVVVSGLVDRFQKSRSRASELQSSIAGLQDASISQASAVHETTTTLEEMRTLGQNSSSHAKNSFEKASSSYEMTISAKQKMREMQASIAKMIQASEDTQDQMKQNHANMADLVNTINEIKSKTAVINDIVFQTKILSFNASVEAARAGEQGKGFAVVAEEVSQLTTLSGKAAKDIGDLLDDSLIKASGLVSATKTKADSIAEHNAEQIALTEKIASELDTVFDQIVANNEQVKGMMNDVSNSVSEYSVGIKNIASAMASLNNEIQGNSDSSVKLSRSSASIEQDADAMNYDLKHLERLLLGVLTPKIQNHGEKTIDQLLTEVDQLAGSQSPKTLKSDSADEVRPKSGFSVSTSAPPHVAVSRVESTESAYRLLTSIDEIMAMDFVAPAQGSPPPSTSQVVSPKVIPLNRDLDSGKKNPVVIKKASGDGLAVPSNQDTPKVPLRSDKRFEDV